MTETLRLNDEVKDKTETNDIISQALQKPKKGDRIETTPIKVDEPPKEDVATKTETKEKDDEQVDGNRQKVTSSENAKSEERQVKTEPKGKGEQSTVPLWVLQEEKEKRRAIQRELEGYKNPPPPPPPPVPDKTTEYDSWLEHQIQSVQETQKQIQERQALDEIGKNYASSAQMFVAQNPDYENCVSNMIEIYAMQLAEDGYDQKQIEAAAQYQIMQMTVEAMKRGFSPAEYIYRKGSKLPRLPHYNGHPVDQQQPKKEKESDIGRLAEAKRKNTSISGNSGQSEATQPEILNDSSIDIAFNKNKQKEWEKARQKLFG